MTNNEVNTPNINESASHKESSIQSHKTESSISINGYPMIMVYSIREIHSISFELDPQRGIALLYILDIKHHSPSELTVMLRYVCELLQQSNIHQVMQQVLEQDWLTILKPVGIFKKYSEGNGFINVVCNVNQFPEAVMKGLGFEEINTKK